MDLALSESDLDRFWALVDKRGPDDCWPWLGTPNHDGYGRLQISGRRYKSHRLSFLLSNGRWPEPCACHSCDVRFRPGDSSYRLCCNARHLFEGSRKENTRHMVSVGRSAFGERGPGAFLSEERARSLLAAKGSVNTVEAAKAFGISQAQVSRIWNGKSWPHLQQRKATT